MNHYNKIQKVKNRYDELLGVESVCNYLGIQSLSGCQKNYHVYQLDYILEKSQIIFLSLMVRLEGSKIMVNTYYGGGGRSSSSYKTIHDLKLSDMTIPIKSRKQKDIQN